MTNRRPQCRRNVQHIHLALLITRPPGLLIQC